MTQNSSGSPQPSITSNKSDSLYSTALDSVASYDSLHHHHPAGYASSPVPSATCAPTHPVSCQELRTRNHQSPSPLSTISEARGSNAPPSPHNQPPQSLSPTERLSSTPSVSLEEFNTRKYQPHSLQSVTEAQGTKKTPYSITEGTSPPSGFPQPERSAEHLPSSLAAESEPTLTPEESDDNSLSPSPGPQSPQSLPIHSTSDKASLKVQQTSPRHQHSGLDPYPRPPPVRLEDFVSPLFLEPFRHRDAVPLNYKARYTTPYFRQVFSDRYDQYVKAKAEDSLPSLFDLEMMAQSSSNDPIQEFEPKEPSDSQWVREALHRYGIHQDDQKAMGRYPKLWKAALAIIEKPRMSDPKEVEITRYRAKLDKYQNANEDTFLHMILPSFIKDERWVPASRTSGPTTLSHVEIQQPASQTPAELPASEREKYANWARLEDKENYVAVEFDSDGMVTNVNRDFLRVLPFPNTSDNGQWSDDLNKRMMKAAHITNPRPDRTFGVSRGKLPWPEDTPIPPAIAVMLEVIRSCYHIFLILEGKSFGGIISEARNQSARGGSIAIHYERVVRAMLGMPDEPGADMDTFMFSVVVTPESLEIWLNWAEVHPHPQHPEEPLKQPTFHMNCIWASVLNDPSKKNLGQIRKRLHNIMDWGLGERLKGLQPLYDAIKRHADEHDHPAKGHIQKKPKTY
ncbi:MAG: hypothetical protein Q9166_007962 [cf. Caloplaca sp. 2 TL-2023]